MPVDDYWGTQEVQIEVDEAQDADLESRPVVGAEARFVPKSVVDAKGDLIVGRDQDAVERLPIGDPGQALVVAADGVTLEYATPVGDEHEHVHVHEEYATDADLAAHAGAGNPHPVYATDGDLSAHASAPDPHTGYQKESERGVADGYAELNASAKVPPTRLGSGTPTSSKFVDGSGAWRVLADGDIPVEIARESDLSNHASAPDPHSVYATDADLAAHTGTPHGGDHPDLAAHDTLGLATQAELNSHAADSDPHTGYQKESEKDITNGYAGLNGNARVNASKIGSGSPLAGTFLAGQGAGEGAWTAHGSGGDPHPQYATDSDLAAHTASDHGAGAAASTLAYAPVTTTQGGITTTATTLTGHTVTVNVPASRRLKITAGNMAFFSTVASDAYELRLYEDGILVDRCSDRLPTSASNNNEVTVSWVRTPTAGAHTYELTLHRTAGSGTLSTNPSTNRISYTLVEDITGSVWPAGSTISLGMLPVVPACRVFHSVDQSIAHAVVGVLSFNSQRHVTDNMHSTSTNNSRITFNTAGVYLITGHAAFTSAGDYTDLQLAIRLNGTTWLELYRDRDPGSLTGGRYMNVSTPYKFAAGDYVELIAVHSNGAAAARNVIADPNRSAEFTATFLGGA